MEGWQKGADAVIKMSGAGKENYFKNFPERKEWFQSNYPEHFGRSAAAATSSLKKVTKAKQQKQRLAAIRQAAEKRDQSTVLTPERRLMAQRRREGGEGLAGGMDTVADIRKTIAAGMPVRSGGIGSLFEQEEQQQGVYQKDGKWFYNGAEYKDQETALNAQKTDVKNQELRDELSKVAAKFDSLSSMKDGRQPQQSTTTSKSAVMPTTSADGNRVWTGTGWALPNSMGRLPPDRVPQGGTTGFRDIDGTSVDKVTPPPSNEPIIPDGQEWKKSNPDWGANLGMSYPTNTIDTATELKLLQTPQTSAGRRSDRAYRKPFSNYISIRADEEYVKELAEKTIQECMPMPGSMMPLKMRILSMKSKDEGSEQTEAEDEPGEYDYEGDMAKSQLRSIMHNSKMLHDILEDNTNLPEWVQSKITLAEDYILTASNYMRGELDKMNEEADMGGDLPFDPNAERPEMPAGKQPEQYRYVRGLARKAMKAGIAATVKPETAQELVAQHNSLHNPQGEVMEEGAGAANKRSKSDDLVKRSMLPDKSVIPAGKGFGDDLKKQKIMKKVGKALQKKKMALPTDNPSANELVPQSMLPDVPGYPQGYQMEEQVAEQVVEQPVEQQVETPVVEENVSPFVAAGSKFLTRTSTRLVYGEKDE